MKTKVIILLTLFFTGCLAASAPTPSEVITVLIKVTVQEALDGFIATRIPIDLR